MVLVANDMHAYTRKDLQCMNMLRHPVWVFDIDTMSMYWANAAAVSSVWNAASLQELLLRDFKSDMSEGSKSWLLNFQQNELQKNTYATEKWTYYPNGTAQILDVSCSAIRIPTHTHSDSAASYCTSAATVTACKVAMLVEVELSENQTKITDSTSRSLEILKHLPVAVSEFTLDGAQLIYQNPKALKLFGTPRSGSSADDPAVGEGEEKLGDNDENADAALDASATTGSTKPNQTSNELLQRFVDLELGKKALLSMQNNETFSAETKLYIQRSAVEKSIESIPPSTPTASSANGKSRKLKLKQKIQENDDSTSSGSLLGNDAWKPQHQPHLRWFNVTLRKARDPITSDFVILFTARDISDIVKARNDTVQAAMKSEFLDVMAHEIRTPLHQIVGYMDLLDDESYPLSKDQMNYVQQAQSSCSFLMTIINDLLDCSKLEYGQLQVENISFTIPSVVHSCLGAIGAQIQAKGLQLNNNLDDPLCTTLQNRVISDPNRLRQILHNLLSNAVKFTETGSISITVHPVHKSGHVVTHENNENVQQYPHHTQWFRFEVIDTGIGIAPNEQTIVFERYRQANASVARNFGGTGLGLPICKGLVELLGGTIGLQSEVGKGTTIFFELPFLISPSECNKFDGAVRRLSSLADDMNMDSSSLPEDSKPIAMNILVVEDNKVNQKIVKAMLQRLGHVVTLAENGEIALHEITQQQFQVILMDIQMPVMDGIECTKYIRSVLHFTKEQLPILGLTAGYQHSDRDYYVNEIGMNGCLGKPLPMEKLKQALSLYSRKVERS